MFLCIFLGLPKKRFISIFQHAVNLSHTTKTGGLFRLVHFLNKIRYTSRTRIYSTKSTALLLLFSSSSSHSSNSDFLQYKICHSIYCLVCLIFLKQPLTTQLLSRTAEKDFVFNALFHFWSCLWPCTYKYIKQFCLCICYKNSCRRAP